MRSKSMDYNPIARKYDMYEKDATTLWLLGYPSVLKFLEPVTHKHILDYGCGSGIFSRYLRDNGAIVTGVDVSERMIQVAGSDNAENISYHNITSGEIGFLEDCSFDHAVTNFVLCTVPSIEEIRKIIKEIHRVLKNDGLFIIMNSNWERSNGKEFISYRLEYCEDLSRGKRINAVLKTDPPIIFEDWFWSSEDYIQVLADCGFTVQFIEEPVARDHHIPWLDEVTHPPFIIFVAKKI